MTKLQWKFGGLCWRLADWLSFLACKLRGHKWYPICAGYGIHGNRASDLKHKVWELSVFSAARTNFSHQDDLDEIEKALGELAQLAGENWGHHPQTKPNP